MYELWKKDHGRVRVLNQRATAQDPTWRLKNQNELNELILQVISTWSNTNLLANTKYLTTADLDQMFSRAGNWTTRGTEWFEKWRRIHQIFDELEIPEPIRREYCKEVYFSNKLNNK